MKKICFAVLTFLGGFLAGHCQTLEFTNAMLVTSLQTVPTGHVWKVENILPTARLAQVDTDWTDAVGTTDLDKIITVNSQDIIVHSSSATTKIQQQLTSSTSTIRSGLSGYGFADGLLSGPIWLPAGTTIAPSTGVYAVSVLDFTLNP